MLPNLIRFLSRFSRLAGACLVLCVCGCARADNAPLTPPAPQVVAVEPGSAVPSTLDDYVARPEPNYKWEKVEEQKNPQNTVAVLKMVSQTWQGKDWTHRVEIIRPAKVEFPDTALVLVSFGTVSDSTLALLLARQIGATVINVASVPNQPLYNLREDALIAYTFQKFMENGDTSWPLLLPMTKSVIKAMDACQEYSKQNDEKPLSKFVVAGASKRGWTSWLVAAADSRLHPNRVAGLIPLVYNNLNIPRQLPHQLESWGKYSEMIGDYTKLGLQDQTSTSRGAQLVAIVDPYTYRARFTMPKLLINGTNDRYWTPDATQFYLNDLPGWTSLYFAPNAGHDLTSDLPNVLSTAAAWFRLVAQRPNLILPKLELEMIGNDAGGAGIRQVEQRKGVFLALPPHKYEVSLHNEQEFIPGQVERIQLWVAHSRTRDFRAAQWNSMNVPMWNRAGTSVLIPQTPKDDRYSAAFAQLTVADNFNSIRLQLATPIIIWTRDASTVSSQ
jgi:PhoPQ-activated pathogenicity-related protein